MEILSKIIDATPRNFQLGVLISAFLLWSAYFFWRNHFSSKVFLERKKEALEIFKLLHEMDSLSIDNFEEIKNQIRKEVESVLTLSNNLPPIFSFPKFRNVFRRFERVNWRRLCFMFATIFLISLSYWAVLLSQLPKLTANLVNGVLIFAAVTFIFSFFSIGIWLGTVKYMSKIETFFFAASMTLPILVLFPRFLGFVLELCLKILNAYAN